MEKYTKKIIALLGPTNTGKTYVAIEKMFQFDSGIFGLPLRLLAREVYDKCVEKIGVETRPIISGNFLKQPSIKKYNLLLNSKFINSDIVNKHGFFIGLPTSPISDKKIKKLVGAFEESL